MNESSRTPTLTAGGPTIVCPRWCKVSCDSHLSDLPDWDGFVIHLSAERTGDGWAVWHSRSAYIDGTPSEAPEVTSRVDAHLSAAAAEDLANALLEVVAETHRVA